MGTALMKPLFLALVFSLASPAFGQRIVSPEVTPDGRVTFRLQAPQAKEVRLHCEGLDDVALQRDDQGLWVYTSQPLEPDIYAYSFLVDGCRVIDPNNPLLKYNLLNTESQVHVPGPLSLPWELNDVPHGEIHHHFYKSAVAGDERDFYVYTPPGYNPKAHKRYPVLYLLHGYSDDASAWSTVGCANIILDNLIARKQAQPMIVVMPLGYGTMEIVHAGWGRLRDSGLWQLNQERFSQTLLNEVLPQVEAAYRVAAGREHRAIAGLSMGGAEALLVGLNHLDRFAWVGAFSAGGVSPNYPESFPKLDAKRNPQARLLWVGCGQQDGLFGANKRFSDWLTAQQVRHTWVATPGHHSFRVWRRYLARFAPLLFQKGA
jgi:enterochelin esterase-like enzyme